MQHEVELRGICRGLMDRFQFAPPGDGANVPARNDPRVFQDGPKPDAELREAYDVSEPLIGISDFENRALSSSTDWSRLASREATS